MNDWKKPPIFDSFIGLPLSLTICGETKRVSLRMSVRESTMVSMSTSK